MSTLPKHPNTPNANWQGAFDAFSTALELIKKNPQPALLIVLVFGLFGVVDTVLSGGSTDLSGETSATSYSIIASLLFMLALPVYGLKLADGKKTTLGKAMHGTVKRYFYVIAAFIMAGLLMAASFFAFIIPAIWVVAWFTLTQYPVAETGMNPNKALSYSRALTTDHKAKVWGVIGVTVLLSIVASFLSFIPAVGIVVSNLAVGFVSVLSSVAFALLYRWLQTRVKA